MEKDYFVPFADFGEDKFEEKRSKFTGRLWHVETAEDAVAKIKEMREKYWDATHNCYAYILRENNAARHSDDGEPGGTAGVPIYEVLRKEGLTDVCCVVTRYFGGVLLGAGGLVRAYTKGAKDAVDAAQIKCMAEAVKLAVTVDYGLYGRLAQVFADFDAAAKAMVHVKDTFQPNERNHEVYNDIYEQAYRKIYPRLRPIYQKLIQVKRRIAQ